MDNNGYEWVANSLDNNTLVRLVNYYELLTKSEKNSFDSLAIYFNQNNYGLGGINPNILDITINLYKSFGIKTFPYETESECGYLDINGNDFKFSLPLLNGNIELSIDDFDQKIPSMSYTGDYLEFMVSDEDFMTLLIDKNIEIIDCPYNNCDFMIVKELESVIDYTISLCNKSRRRFKKIFNIDNSINLNQDIIDDIVYQVLWEDYED